MSAAWTQEFTGAHANRNMQMGRTDTLLRWELSVFLVNGHMQQQTLWSFPDVSALAELTTDNDIWLQCSAALTAPPRTLRAEETLKIWNISPLCLSRLPLSPRLAPAACVCSPFLSSFTFASSPLLHLSPFLLSLLLLAPLSSPCVSSLVSFCYVPPFFPISPLSSPCVSSFVSSLVSLCVLSPPFVSSYYFLSSLNFLSARPSFYLLFFLFLLLSPFLRSCLLLCRLSPHFSFLLSLLSPFVLSPLLVSFFILSSFLSPLVSSLLAFCLFSSRFPFCLLPPSLLSSLFSFCLLFPLLVSPLFSLCLLSCFLMCPPSSSFVSSLVFLCPLSALFFSFVSFYLLLFCLLSSLLVSPSFFLLSPLLFPPVSSLLFLCLLSPPFITSLLLLSSGEWSDSEAKAEDRVLLRWVYTRGGNAESRSCSRARWC